MKEKIMIVSLLAVFALIAVSYSAASISVINRDKKESPLFKIRSARIIKEEIEGVRAKLDGRVFFLPLKLLNRVELSDDFLLSFDGGKGSKCFTKKIYSREKN